jgi:hypothetical protein
MNRILVEIRNVEYFVLLILKSKIIKNRILKFVAFFLTSIITLSFIVLLLIKNPFVQTVLARVATIYLENELNTEVKIARLEFNPFRRIYIKNMLIMDQHQDTLLFTGELKVKWERLGFKNRKFKPRTIELSNADIRLKKYLNEERLNYSFILDYFATGKELITDSLPKEPLPLNFSFDKINISNCRFVFEDQNDTATFKEINFSDIDLRIDTFQTDAVSINGDSIVADIRQLSFHEKSGFRVDSLSGNFIFCPTLLQADNLLVRTLNNDLNLDVKFNYDSMDSFNDFIHSVNIQATLRPTMLNLVDVGYFAPILFKMDNKINVEGNISGTVDNFKARNFKFSYGEQTYFNGAIQMNGLPDFFETFIHLSINDFSTSASDVAMFNLPIENNRIPLPEFLNKLGITHAAGKFTGFYNDFVSYGKFSSDLGQINTDLLLRVNSKNDIEYKGKIATQDLDVGTLFELESYLNNLTLTAEVRGHGFDFETMDLTVNGVIQSLDFLENTYNEVDVSGSLSDKKFNGAVNIRDELVNLDFNGIIDYSQLIPAYKFIAEIDSAQLNKMNLVTNDSVMYLSTKLDIDLSGNQFDNLQGIIKLDSTRYIQNGKLYAMNDFTLSVTRDGTEYTLVRLFSDIADVSVEGKFMFRDMPYFTNAFLNQYLDTLFVDLAPNDLIPAQDFTFDVEFKNPDPVTELFVPQLQIATGTMLSGGFNSKINNLFIDANSDDIIYAGIRFTHLDAELLIHNNDFVLTTFSDHFFLNDSLTIDSIHTSFSVGGDSLVYAIKWNNQNWETSNYGDLEGHLIFLSPKEMELKMKRGEIVINDTIWEISPSNYFRIDTTSLSFSNFGLTSSEQGLFMDGKISANPKDTLVIRFNNFNLSNIDRFLSKSGINLDGLINGNFRIVNLYKTPNYLADIKISGLGFNGEKLGEGLLNIDWEPRDEVFNILAQIIYEGNVGKSKTLEIAGAFYPNKKNKNYDISISLNNYKLKTIGPFVRDFSSKIDGLATGELTLTGATNEPVLTGNINLMRTQMKIDYLNVTYFLADKINFKENLIYFDDIIVYDSLNNQATVTGKIYHDHFKNFNFDLNFNADKLLGLNTTRSQNESFYGSAFASGIVNISGPPDNLAMKINVKSEKGTNIKIPASYGTEVGDNEYIIFLDPNKDTTNQEPKYEVDTKGISLFLALNVTPDANIQLFLPYQMGNIQANGKGDINMDINKAGNLTMEGEYIINRGSFFLTLQSIINRDFEIKRGGKITWTGDPYNAQIDLKAIYKVKTSLGEYGPPEDSASRVQVDCVIALSKSLFDPEIKFTIEFPELKEDTKQYIYSQLDTTDQAMMSQQMISLLLLNSFSYSSGTSGSVGFNAFSLLTNQLNNYLSGLSNNVDIGVNYRPSSEISTDEVELALSTRLWNDRITIDGNVGYGGKQTTSNLIGEVTVEVKITDDGRFRTKVFNKSNNDDLYKSYAPYTQGVGVFYTQDFNRFGDLFKRKNKKPGKDKLQEQTMIDK